MTFAAGLATEGFKPFAAIYSTFLQRAYDQVVHDVAIQRLPVRFAIDRAGLVGADGPTHAGSFDVAYLGCLPGFVVMAAADEAELVHMVATAVAIDDRPSAFRYPRGEGVGVPMPAEGIPLEIGKGRVLREGTKVALLSFGARLGECLKAADELAALGLSTTVADARFAKPLDADLLLRLAREHEVLITIEEGSIGGFGAQVLQALADHGVLDRGLKVRRMVLPDIFIDQDTPAAMYATAGLDAKGIVAKAFEALGQNLRGEAVKLIRALSDGSTSRDRLHGHASPFLGASGGLSTACLRSELRRLALRSHHAPRPQPQARSTACGIAADGYDTHPAKPLTPTYHASMSTRIRIDRLLGRTRPVREPRQGAGRHRRRPGDGRWHRRRQAVRRSRRRCGAAAPSRRTLTCRAAA